MHSEAEWYNRVPTQHLVIRSSIN